MAVLARINLGTTIVVAMVSTALVALAIVGLAPSQIGPLGVTIWFLGFFAALATLLAVVLHTIKRLVLKKLPGPKFQASLRQGLLISAWASVNMALSSLRQLSFRDGLLTAMLAILIEFYLRLK